MTEPEFKRASEYTPDELALMTVNFQTYFTWLINMAKENAPDNMSISVKGSIGIHAAEITYTAPPTRYTRSQPKLKPLNLIGAQGVVAEYPDFMDQPNDIGEYWFIRTKKNMGDQFQVVNGKLRDVGFSYVRYDKDTPNTGGWRAKK